MKATSGSKLWPDSLEYDVDDQINLREDLKRLGRELREVREGLENPPSDNLPFEDLRDDLELC